MSGAAGVDQKRGKTSGSSIAPGRCEIEKTAKQPGRVTEKRLKGGGASTQFYLMQKKEVKDRSGDV